MKECLITHSATNRWNSASYPVLVYRLLFFSVAYTEFSDLTSAMLPPSCPPSLLRRNYHSRYTAPRYGRGPMWRIVVDAPELDTARPLTYFSRGHTLATANWT